MKALVLSAGFGKRLVPLSHYIPKPALPVLGKSVLQLVLSKILGLESIRDVAINTHHLREKILPLVEPYKKQISIFESFEKEIQGTGGAIIPLEEWRNGDELLVMNGDVVTNFFLSDLIRFHKSGNYIATMGALAMPHSHTKSCLWLENQKVKSISNHPHPGSTPHGFACIHILTQEFLKYLPKNGPCEIMPIYQKLIAEGHSIGGCVDERAAWWDIGSPQSYFAMHQSLLLSYQKRADATQYLAEFGFRVEDTERISYSRLQGRDLNHSESPSLFYFHDSNLIGEPSHIKNSILYSGQHSSIYGRVNIENHSEIVDSILFEGAHILQGAKIKNSIIGQDFKIENLAP